MIVTADKTTYGPIPEDGELIFDQLSLSLYRASMFHKQPYDNWFITISRDELNALERDPRIEKTLGAFDVMNRKFKGIIIKVDDERPL